MMRSAILCRIASRPARRPVKPTKPHMPVFLSLLPGFRYSNQEKTPYVLLLYHREKARENPRPLFSGGGGVHSMCFLCRNQAVTPQITSVSPSTIANPAWLLANGMPSEDTFMPYKPLTTVGTAISRVMLVRYFMALFRRLS